MSVRSRSKWNLEVFIFEEREKRNTRRKTSRSNDDNQQETQPTYMYGVDARIRTRTTLVGGECSHHCATPHFCCSGAVHCFVAAAKVKFQTGQNLSVNLSVLTNRQNLSVVGLSVHVS